MLIMSIFMRKFRMDVFLLLILAKTAEQIKTKFGMHIVNLGNEWFLSQ